MERDEIRYLKELPDEQLIELSLKGSTAFDEIVRRYYKKVYYFALRILRDREDAEDITQETFFRTYRSLRQYDPRHKFTNWLLKITTNLAINYRKKYKVKPVSIEETGIEITAPLEDSNEQTEQLQNRVDEILDSLTPKYKVAFALVHRADLNYQEAAELMGVPLGTLKTYIYKARNIITTTLQKGTE